MSLHTADTSCCGLEELCEISSAKGPLAVLKFVKSRWRSAFYVFTGVTRYEDKKDTFIPLGWSQANYGEELADTIRRLGLGPVTRSMSGLNDSSGNNIRVWTWRPNWEALRKADLEEPKWKKGRSLSTSKAVVRRRRNIRRS